MVIVTSTSADLKPEHCISIENVSISVGTFPTFEILTDGRGKTSKSDDSIFMLYGSYSPHANEKKSNKQTKIQSIKKLTCSYRNEKKKSEKKYYRQ